MSKISLSPDANGTGIFTIASPNSNTNRTLTLPDNAGTIQTQLDNGFSFRNRIINGDMRIDQRNAGAAVTISSGSNSSYCVDRWQGFQNTDGEFTLQQVTDAPAGFTNSLRFTTTTADASMGATQFVALRQMVEGFNTADLGFGAAGAASVTLSFWTKSSLTGTFGGALLNSAENRSYPFTYTISAANTWEQKTVTITGDTTGTWPTNNGIGFRLTFGLGVGSTYSGTAGAWTGSSFIYTATGAVSVIGTLNATWYITGVQLEVGSVATPFERRPYGTELQLCQRYYIKYLGNDGGGGGYATFFLGMNSSATSFVITPFFPVPLRAANPTQTWGGTLRLLYPGGATSSISGISGSNQQIGVTGGYGAYNVSNTGYATAGVIGISGGGDNNAYWAFSSEL